MWTRWIVSLWILLISVGMVSVSMATPTPVALPELIDLAWSPDGTRFVYGLPDGTIHIMDAP